MQFNSNPFGGLSSDRMELSRLNELRAILWQENPDFTKNPVFRVRQIPQKAAYDIISDRANPVASDFKAVEFRYRQGTIYLYDQEGKRTDVWCFMEWVEAEGYMVVVNPLSGNVEFGEVFLGMPAPR